MKELINYLKKTRAYLETWHSDENCDILMEHVLELSLSNWMGDEGTPNLTEPQWVVVRNKLIDKKYNRVTYL